MILEIPLYVFLLIYFAFLFIFAIFIVVNFYHIFSSDVITLWSFIVTVGILATTVFVLFGTHQALGDVNWQQSVTLLNIVSDPNDFFSESSF